MREHLLSLEVLRGNSANPVANELICEFVRIVLGENVDFAPCISLGVLDDGELIGAVVFHDWQKYRRTIEITGAATSPKWLTRAVINEIAKQCFVELDVYQIVARCDAQNGTTNRIFNALGFKSIIIPNMRGPNRHERFFYQTADGWQNMRFSK